ARLCGFIGVTRHADHSGLPLLREAVPGPRRVCREAGEVPLLRGRRVGPHGRGSRLRRRADVSRAAAPVGPGQTARRPNWRLVRGAPAPGPADADPAARRVRGRPGRLGDGPPAGRGAEPVPGRTAATPTAPAPTHACPWFPLTHARR